MMPVEVSRGDSPLVLGFPHTGTYVPEEMFARLTPRGQTLADTDWHVHRLYDSLLPDVTTVRATFHRYVVDANRDPSGESLYPGQNTTGLVPMTDFDGAPLWQTAPDAAEIEARRVTYHAAYHEALEAELFRVREKYGLAILYDCHSIRSEVPFLFEGTLPVFNLGTNNGETCDRRIEQAAHDIATYSPHPTVLNGRFKGGWTTRHYGRPKENIHAIQMELAQRTYLASEIAPWAYAEDKAETLRHPWLRDILQAILDTAYNMREEMRS